MAAVWDPRKASASLRKHGIRFSDAEGALYDPFSVTREDPTAEGERRFVTVGSDFIGRTLVVVFGVQGEDMRLISARRATRRERSQYEEGIRL